MARRFTPGRVLWGAAALALLGILVRIGAIQGWIRPARIVSGSMAERLLGEHLLVRCAQCSFPFPFGVESPPSNDHAVCPNCGFEANPVERAERLRGHRVLVDRAAYWFAKPARWDVVACPHPEDAARQVVKRVVGLGGEQIAIRRGDIWRDGQLVRKSWTQFRRMAVLVHDDRYRTALSPSVPRRWRPAGDRTGWSDDEHRVVHRDRGAPGPGDDAEWDWLVYHHWRCYASPFPRTAEAPLADNLGYNQGESRELQSMGDIAVRLHLAAAGKGEFAVRVHDGWDWAELCWTAASGTCRVVYGGRVRGEVPVPSGIDWGDCAVEFGVFDEQVVLALNQQELARMPLVREQADRTAKPPTQPAAIGARQLEVEVSRLQVWRDVYYLDPACRGEPWQTPGRLPDGHLLLLGDNPSLSEDGRIWPGAGVADRVVRGRVIPLPW